MIVLFGSAGQAERVLDACRKAEPVAHVILYNANGSEGAVAAMMARGRERLGRIPGVTRVQTGWAVQDEARYRCCWIIEFAHPAVIASYRDHPAHVEFANTLFRPIAGDRITIDYQIVAGASASKEILY